MIRIVRAVLCDTPDCPNASIDVLRTADADVPDWQGWTVVPQVDGEKHYCPDCGPVKVGSEWPAEMKAIA